MSQTSSLGTKPSKSLKLGWICQTCTCGDSSLAARGAKPALSRVEKKKLPKASSWAQPHKQPRRGGMGKPGTEVPGRGEPGNESCRDGIRSTHSPKGLASDVVCQRTFRNGLSLAAFAGFPTRAESAREARGTQPMLRQRAQHCVLRGFCVKSGRGVAPNLVMGLWRGCTRLKTHAVTSAHFSLTGISEVCTNTLVL